MWHYMTACRTEDWSGKKGREKLREKDKCKRPSQSILLFLISFSSSASPVAVCQRVRMDCLLWKKDNLYLPYE